MNPHLITVEMVVAAAAMLAFTTLNPVSAQAADVGFCTTPAQMTEVLKAEGQRSLAHGKQIKGLIFTADKEGKVGYIIRSDRPIGTMATKMCVADRMHDVKLYDARKPSLPPEVFLKSTPEAAAKKCKELSKEGIITRNECGFHNDMLNNMSKFGDRVMFQGLGVKKQPDGTYASNGILITITANMTGDKTSRDGRSLIQYSLLPEGASFLASVFTDAAYTQAALNELSH
jgi:hypothetical protein